MLELKLNRRDVLKWMGTAFGALLFSPLRSPAWAALSGRHADSKFTEVSAALLGASAADLDSRVARSYWKHLSALPGAPERLNALHEAIRKNKGSIFESEKAIPESDRPFAKRIIRAWYTGVVETPTGDQRRLFYDESLMFKSFLKDRPAPVNCYGAFGDWVKRPEA